MENEYESGPEPHRPSANVQGLGPARHSLKHVAAAFAILASVAFCAKADTKESWTVTAGETLTEDVTVEGALAIANGSDICLNGHKLTLKGGFTAASASGSANIVQNPSFEEGTAINTGLYGYWPGTDNTYYLKSAPTGWELATTKVGCSMRDGNNSPWIRVSIPDGKYVCYLQTGGGVKQSLTVAESGLYDISFYCAVRPNTAFSGGIITLSIGGKTCVKATLGKTDTTARTASATVWVDAGTHELRISHANNPNVNNTDQSVWIDNISVKKTAKPYIYSGSTAGELRIETDDSNLFTAGLPGVTFSGDITSTYALTNDVDWSGSGTLELAGKKVLDLNGFEIETAGVKGGTGAGTLVFNGGTLKAAAAGALIAAGDNLAIETGAGNAKIDTQNFDVSIAEDITGIGALVKSGAGTLTLNVGQTGAGALQVNEGAVALASGATVSVQSLSFASGTAIDIAAFEPGVAPIAVSGVLTLPSEGTVALTCAGGAFGFGEYAILSKSGISAAAGEKFAFTVQDGYTAEWRTSGDDLVLAVMSSRIDVANVYGNGTLPLPKNTATTISGAGGLKLDHISIPEGATLVYDPIATPIKLDTAP